MRWVSVTISPPGARTAVAVHRGDRIITPSITAWPPINNRCLSPLSVCMGSSTESSKSTESSQVYIVYGVLDPEDSGDSEGLADSLFRGLPGTS